MHQHPIDPQNPLKKLKRHIHWCSDCIHHGSPNGWPHGWPHGWRKACAVDAADKALLPATFKAMEDLMHAWHGRWTKPQIPWFNLEKTPNTSLQYLQLGWGWRLRVCRYKVKKWRGPSTKSKTWVKSDSEFSAKSPTNVPKKVPLYKIPNRGPLSAS